METKQYFITISGESGASTIKSLTESERKLIEDIFDECESRYVDGHIEELPSDEEIVKMFSEYEKNKHNGVYVITFNEYAKMNKLGNFSPSLCDYMYLRNQAIKSKS